MHFRIFLLVLALIMATLDAVMMISIKKYYIGDFTFFFGIVVPMLIYSLQPLLFYKALDKEGIGIYNVLWDSMSNIFVLLAGILIFSERVTTTKYIGMVLSFIGILLMTSK